jgi:cell division control protein 7
MTYLHSLGGKAHVLPLLGALRHKDQVSLVLPYVEHHKFKDYLPTMNVMQIRSYMKALFTALEHVHANKIIHRDVKPGNFLYNPNTNTFVLVDFGLAQSANAILETATVEMKKGRGFALPSISQITGSCPTLKRKRIDSLEQLSGAKRRYVRTDATPSTLVRTPSIPPPVQSVAVKKTLRAPRGGTRGFRAPEVLLKCHHQTIAIDIWSAGVILLCILSTRYPFFTAPDDLVSLAEIAALFGTQELREVALKLNRTIKFPCDPQNIPKTPLKDLCNKLTSRKEQIPDSAFHLLERCLDLNPSSRITAKEALNHPFFHES